ncbi:MAG: DUF2148 domain-containing protein [Candidatus Omnitrophota bacterium]|nr:DUF2148 domain-containing protein [Candidatus Omnitrophota bacterium]
MRRSPELERSAVVGVSQLMAVAARTAPKTRGIDNIEIIVIDDAASVEKLTKKMKELAKSNSRPSMERDANAIAGSPAVVIIGVKSNPAGLNCGFCGYTTCDELKKGPGVCSYNSIDLGISISSAVSVAGKLHVDNRVMYSIGKAALALELLSKDVKQALGLPLSVTGKNPFFDRK